MKGNAASSWSRKEYSLIAVVIAAIVVIAMFSNRKEQIFFKTTVSAPFGGVFVSDSTCTPNQEHAWVRDGLSIISDKGIAQPIPTIEYRPTAPNECTVELLLDLQPDTVYRVSLGGTELGTISDLQFATKTATFRREIKVSKTLEGYLRISQPSGCRSSGNTYWCGAIKLVAAGEYTCEGYGGYEDLGLGTTVRIYSSAGQVVAQTSIDRTRWRYKNPPKRNVIFCELFWEVAGVPYDEKGYSVEMTERRGKVFFTKEESMDMMVTTLGE